MGHESPHHVGRATDGVAATTALGQPHRHLRVTTSTNDVAITLAAGGAPHGTIVTADSQTAGRGRQGRLWTSLRGAGLICSVVVREYDRLLPLRAGLAVADLAGAHARVKWPNDVLIDGGKVAGVLVEARPAEGWAVIGIGINVVTTVSRALPAGAATLGRVPGALESTLNDLLDALAARLTQPAGEALVALRGRDALLDQPVRWADGSGIGAGITDTGSLLVRINDGSLVALDAGEVHLGYQSKPALDSD